MKKITVLSELKNEFSVQINYAKSSLSVLLIKYPRGIFLAMVLFMLGSGLLCFTVLRLTPQKDGIEKTIVNKVGGGISEIGLAVTKLEKTLKMREQLKAIVSKDSLTAQDSLLIVRMIGELDKTPKAK